MMLDRRDFVRELLVDRGGLVVVTGLGSATYDVTAAGDHPLNFYQWGGMGGTAMMGLGLALARPDRRVAVITGDGDALMGLGSFATIGVKQPGNLAIVVLDNGHYGETGMQRSHTSLGVDLVAVARGFGIADAFSTGSLEHADDVARRIEARAATAFVQVFVEANEAPRVLPPRDGAFVRNRFRAALGLKPF